MFKCTAKLLYEKSRTAVFFAVLVFSLLCLLVDTCRAAEEQLFSPSIAQRFYELAHEMADSENLTKAQTEQAAILLIAAMNLDNRAKEILKHRNVNIYEEVIKAEKMVKDYEMNEKKNKPRF